MGDYGLKFHHAGTPEPADLPVAQTSAAVPTGNTGIGGFWRPETVEQVGAVYGRLAEASRTAALSKRDAEQAVLDK
jgi:hypothetical protein